MALFSRGALSFQNLASPWREHYVTSLFCPLAVLDLRPFLLADFGWVFDFLFGETEEMSKYVKTFRWPLPKSSKKIQSPTDSCKMQPRAQGMSGFSPQRAFSHFETSLEETTGIWKALLQQETSGETTFWPTSMLEASVSFVLLRFLPRLG